MAGDGPDSRGDVRSGCAESLTKADPPQSSFKPARCAQSNCTLSRVDCCGDLRMTDAEAGGRSGTPGASDYSCVCDEFAISLRTTARVCHFGIAGACAGGGSNPLARRLRRSASALDFTVQRERLVQLSRARLVTYAPVWMMSSTCFCYGQAELCLV